MFFSTPGIAIFSCPGIALSEHEAEALFTTIRAITILAQNKLDELPQFNRKHRCCGVAVRGHEAKPHSRPAVNRQTCFPPGELVELSDDRNIRGRIVKINFAFFQCSNILIKPFFSYFQNHVYISRFSVKRKDTICYRRS